MRKLICRLLGHRWRYIWPGKHIICRCRRCGDITTNWYAASRRPWRKGVKTV